MAINVSETRDKILIAKFCQADPALYAYYLGDLDDFFFDRTRWWVAADSCDDAPSAITLWYQSSDLLVIQGLGHGAAQERTWREVLPLCSGEIHVHYHTDHEPIFAETYGIRPLGKFYKMRLERPFDSSVIFEMSAKAKIARSEDRPQIDSLLERAYPGSYFDHRLLETSKCAVVFVGDTAVSFAACHVCSEEHSVASLGAIVTDPDFRRRGLATATTAKILSILQGKIKDICLNVHSENSAAISIYEKLGFEIHCEYHEAILTRHN
ncbi:GNAT family N-acetyltransferase [Gemmatimonas aurantiaca]|nr:GNAT family N-acetyltransferase [Gemmatimonas aurantiaca]